MMSWCCTSYDLPHRPCYVSIIARMLLLRRLAYLEQHIDTCLYAWYQRKMLAINSVFDLEPETVLSTGNLWSPSGVICGCDRVLFVFQVL